jgi:short-subunit dehydrogenase
MGNPILVTGASSGLGRALVEALSANGTEVVAVARPSKRLQALAGLPRVQLAPLDLSKLESFADWAAEITAQHGPLKAIIHNAGIQVDAPFMESSEAEIIREITVNLTAPLLLTRLLLPDLEADGHIVMVGSVLGYIPKRVSAVYSASKAGLRLFAAGLRLQRPQLCIQDVMVPVLDTPMTAHRTEKKANPAAAARAILTGMEKRRPTIWVGQTKAMRVLLRVAPKLAARILAR